MTKYTLALLTAGISLAAVSSALAEDPQHWHEYQSNRHWQGHDWDPPAGHVNQPAHFLSRPMQVHAVQHRAQVHRFMYAPRHGAHVRNYVYYPQARAYYAPWNHRWYYQQDNTWVAEEAAPINISLGDGINISLGADLPYTYDSYVVQNYESVY